MPISDEHAARTICRDHLVENTSVQQWGARKLIWYSQCEAKRPSACRFSHTLLNLDRVIRLGQGRSNYVVSLEYGHGYERYGVREDWASGWDVVVDDKKYRSGGSDTKTYNLPKSLLLAECELGMLPYSPNDKTQAICRNFEEMENCKRVNCRFDHGVIDSRRFERLVRWGTEGISRNCEYLSVECRTTNGDGVPEWKITLKPDAFGKLKPDDPMAKNIPDRPFSYRDEDLFKLLRRVEQMIGSSTPRTQTKNWEYINPR